MNYYSPEYLQSQTRVYMAKLLVQATSPYDAEAFDKALADYYAARQEAKQIAARL